MTTLADDAFNKAKDALTRAAYRALLQREPDPDAVATLQATPFSDKEEAALEEALALFVGSEEFQRIQAVGKAPDFAPSTWARVEVEDLKLWVDIGDLGVSRHCVTGAYEPAETTFVKNFLTAGMTFVDIGANIGWFTVNAARIVGPTGRVLSFEPRADTYAALNRSLEDNDFLSFCHAYNNAVGDAPGELLIGWNNHMGNPGGTWLLSVKGLEDAFLNSRATVQKTDVVTLDSVVGDAPVDLIKIDVEGAELLALTGAVGVLKNQRPTILCEINPSLLKTVSRTDAQTFVQTIEALGYECRQLTLEGDIGAPLCEREAVADNDVINVVFVPVE